MVHYTITITDTGRTPYTGAVVSDDLTGLLDDAAYNGDAGASAGTVSYVGPVLTWTGSLAVGAAATVTFSVTVNSNDAGDKVLATTVTSAAAGSNCAAGNTDARCATSVPVLIPGLDLTVTANTASATPGSTVAYTIVADNTGQTTDTGVSFTASLARVLGDAAYNGNAAASTGLVSFTSPNLTWTGTLAAGATATVTFSVTVNNPDTGDHRLAVTLTSTATGNNCPAGSTDPSCSSTVTVSSLAITNSANVASATPGSVVRFTATFTNTGQTPYYGITISTNAADVFDDAVPDGDQTATSGTLAIVGTAVNWTGDIPVGGTVTVTGTVTVDNPDTGNHLLASTITTAAAGSNCPAGSADPRCSTSVPVLVPGLTITNTPSTTAPVPGSVVGYTLTITDSGQTPYSGITVAESFAQMLDDAAYDGDAAASTGTVSYASPVLTWTGSLSPGGTVTVTFSVTVNDLDTGDKLLIVTATSAAPGWACPAGTTAAPCRSTVVVLTPALDIVATAGAATTVPGATVHYTITITNTGQTPYAGISVADDLSGLLDDAAYDGDAAASGGTLSYTSPTLSWNGDLDRGQSATITFSVTVNNPDTGNKILADTLTSTTPGVSCPASGTAPAACTAAVTVLVPALTITKTANVATTTPGSVVQYTITVADTGQTPYTGATVTDNLTGVLGNAAYNGDAAATTTGTASYASPALMWTGSLTPGGTATITYSVTVNDPDTGNTILTNTVASTAPGSTCPPGTGGSRCSVTTGIIAGPLSITAPASATLGTSPPGGTIQNNLGTIEVTDDRGFGADWTATVSSTGFTTGGGSPAETIPAGEATYTVTGLATATGPAAFTNVTTATLSGSPQAVVSATQVDGDTGVTWDPVIHVTVPAGAIGGAYTATITHSVS